jgi:hypothetical protein
MRRRRMGKYSLSVDYKAGKERRAIFVLRTIHRKTTNFDATKDEAGQ